MYYTTAEAAKMLKIHLATLQKHIRDGNVKTCRPLGLIRISQAEIDRLFSQQK